MSYAINISPQEVSHNLTNEQVMFRAVIGMVFKDATSYPQSSWDFYRKQLDCYEARLWLLANEIDFPVVCVWAGLDPEYVRERAKALRRAGWPRVYADETDMRPASKRRKKWRSNKLKAKSHEPLCPIDDRAGNGSREIGP